MAQNDQTGQCTKRAANVLRLGQAGRSCNRTPKTHAPVDARGAGECARHQTTIEIALRCSRLLVPKQRFLEAAIATIGVTIEDSSGPFARMFRKWDATLGAAFCVAGPALSPHLID